jgi:hypothetical protein
MQAFATNPLPLTRPNCLVWYPGDPCDEVLQQYHQALELQQRQEWQYSVTARFEKQIVDQRKQIADQKIQIQVLQSKIESQTMEALRSEARSQAILNGIGVIIGVALAFFMVMASFRRLARHSTTPHPERGRAASA